MKREQAIIIGAGPCGLAAAIALKEININPLIIEKGNVVNAIHGYPTHQTFFSTSEKLEIGDVAFLTEQYKPNRNQALVYYREVVKRKELRINAYEEVIEVQKTEEQDFIVKTKKSEYLAPYIIVATGYYDHPNYMNIPGEESAKVMHYFKEAHPYFNHDVTVIGGKNSSVDAAIELVKAGARVTVLYRGSEYSSSIKPWILPEFESLVRKGTIKMEFQASVVEIKETSLLYEVNGKLHEIKNDFVFAMTGYHPDHEFLKKMGVEIEKETGRPVFDPETMETNVNGIFIAGVIAAGNNANEIFIENGRFHGVQIANAILEKTR
ncbi:YpdA family putative bacillithiol disulfide reductase [Cytobacillus oceanisediminis]|uniref:YpdA family putative bacillithiol disulfide reductase n=1 Tax=Niallia alba TaxID=2729105 RepID=A0A7Y0PMY8_9BACI|nr:MULTISPECIES: YpdA family putative bacillithiol disulfide reductase [Bacillaceae]EOR23484.1 FAD-dependent pyridine nucleotide-disulfide oxidoreductase [Niallia nealsonii AAU1]MBQ6447352.1 YpdA family putative bacillithiol disulfide reductase [Bacillus sp. (in: firmicutes)]MBZ9533874.1 YpdA family putative bacillithiol disulfide reductase [Cytobacillus oceanisediminis]NMO78275.1 YpdA family putative bacillithiol disulfide reductase [Niallia alba]UTI41551.1 YpdA family putative bacillithiol d